MITPIIVSEIARMLSPAFTADGVESGMLHKQTSACSEVNGQVVSRNYRVTQGFCTLVKHSNNNIRSYLYAQHGATAAAA